MYFISTRESFARYFFLVSLFGIIMYLVLAFYTFHVALTSAFKAKTTQMKIKGYPDPEILKNRFEKDLKYILLWTIPDVEHSSLPNGQKTFIDNNCANINCFLTTNKSLLNNDVKNFDAIVFSINTLRRWKKNMPRTRSIDQKYVFYSMAPANEYPVCNIKADYFFNWTWTYKLYSDIVTPFIEVRDLKGKVVAPKTEVDWPADMVRTNSSQSKTKSKAIVWYKDNCKSNIHVDLFVKELQAHLKEHSLALDIYGCGKKCPKGDCLKAIERDYYFYLAFEDSITDDYVTKEVLKALNHNAVPVVIGGADYSKFLPPGSYIDARYESAERLAGLIEYVLRNPSIYNKYFAWKNYYTIREAKTQDGYCQLCSLLNDKVRMSQSTYETFRKWWYYGTLKEKCLPKGAETFDEVLSYINNTDLRKSFMP